MYRITDKFSAIKRIQEYLRIIYEKEFISPSGIYDEKTRNLVGKFQAEHNLKATGVVDNRTFDLLYEEFSLSQKNEETRRSLSGFIRFPLREGAQDSALSHINEMLIWLLDYYGKAHKVRLSNFYSSGTAEGVRMLRKIYLLGENDHIDEELYRRMVVDRNLREDF